MRLPVDGAVTPATVDAGDGEDADRGDHDLDQ
jgi:hypothetical protein